MLIEVHGLCMEQAIMKAWQKACHCSQGPSKVVIPEGIYMVAQVIFAGPCKYEVIVELQGTMVADKDVSQFPNHEFVVFQDVDAATFTGPGTIDVSNQASKYHTLDQNKDVDFFNLMAVSQPYPYFLLKKIFRVKSSNSVGGPPIYWVFWKSLT